MHIPFKNVPKESFNFLLSGYHIDKKLAIMFNIGRFLVLG